MNKNKPKRQGQSNNITRSSSSDPVFMSKLPEFPEFIEEALSLAKLAAEEGEVPVGAVLIVAGQIVGKGYNRREKDHNPVAHAEIMAIQDAAKNLRSWRLEGGILVVTLEPCPMCLGACQQARLAKVFYGAADPKGGALSLGYRFHEDSKTNHRFSVELVKNSECSNILSQFFKNMRSKKTGKLKSILMP